MPLGFSPQRHDAARITQLVLRVLGAVDFQNRLKLDWGLVTY
jgi:hypothetical protein